MKNIAFISAFLLSNFCASQGHRTRDPHFNKNHEIKFNIGHFFTTSTVEGSYEYFLNKDTSIGGTIYVNDDATDYNGNFGIGPNIRAYFGFEPRSGFFAEVFGLYRTGEKEIDFLSSPAILDYETFAIGIGGGTKLTNRSQRFTVEGNLGVGKNFGNSDFQDSFIYRLGLSVGFRF